MLRSMKMIFFSFSMKQLILTNLVLIWKTCFLRLFSQFFKCVCLIIIIIRNK